MCVGISPRLYQWHKRKGRAGGRKEVDLLEKQRQKECDSLHLVQLILLHCRKVLVVISSLPALRQLPLISSVFQGLSPVPQASEEIYLSVINQIENYMAMVTQQFSFLPPYYSFPIWRKGPRRSLVRQHLRCRPRDPE